MVIHDFFSHSFVPIHQIAVFGFRMPPQLEDVFLASHRQTAMLLQTNMAAHLRNEIKQRLKLEKKVPFFKTC